MKKFVKTFVCFLLLTAFSEAKAQRPWIDPWFIDTIYIAHDFEKDGIEVVHHSVYLYNLVQSGRLKPTRSDIHYVYHDPCELGRGCGIYEEPRKLLRTSAYLVEAAKNREESVCCSGSLGSLTLGFGDRKELTESALRNLTSDIPDAIATACPLCRSTFRRYSDIPVSDIAEVIDSRT